MPQENDRQTKRTQLKSAFNKSIENEILNSLDLPREAVPLFLKHIASFCDSHGGTQRYQELLSLIHRYQEILAQSEFQ